MSQLDILPAASPEEQEARRVMSLARYAESRRQGGTHVSALQPLATQLRGEFDRFAADRQEVEQRWLCDLRQYLGQYEPEVEANLKNRSKAFKRKTRSKVKAVDSRMFDLLFPANKERNFRLKSTPEPTISEQDRQQILATLEPGASENKQREAIREFVDKAATRMASTIDDQLVEARYRKIARAVLHSGNLYGTGVLKGPLVERRMSKVRYTWDNQARRFVPSRQEEFKPFLDYVPLWRFYPDMTVSELSDARAAWERHLMSKHGLLLLARNSAVDGKAVRDFVASLPKGYVKPQNYEQTLRTIGDTKTTDYGQTGQYELLERWGWLDREELACCGCKLPTADDDIYFGQVLMLPTGEPIKATIQPMTGMDWPYHLYYFDKSETSIFGEGLAAIMRGDQENLNAATRAMLDNLAITAGPQIEAYVDLLSPTEKVDEIHPFKIWARTKGDPQYPAIRAINIDSHVLELKQIAEDFDNSADEVTAIPKYMQYGENQTQGAASTASGMSMLMSQANLAIKDQAASWDEGITKPFIGGMYSWNMNFNADQSIHGDFDVEALGAASLVAKEVRAQMLAQYAASATEGELAYIKWHEFAEQRAEANDLTGIVKTKEEVEEEQKSAEAQRQQALIEAQQELQVKLLEKQVAQLGAQVAKLEAETVGKNVDAAYAAMQAGGVAATNPAAAAGGDEILKSAGWIDHTPQDTVTTATEEGSTAPAAQPQAVPALVSPAAGPHQGERAGIHTPEIEGYADGGMILSDEFFQQNYNTPLSPEEHAQYQQWAQAQGRDPAQETIDYDLQGFYKAGGAFGENGHASDEFKKPNHPTFSDQSIYHGTPSPLGGQFVGGSWQQGPQGMRYTPSAEMLRTTHPLPWLQRYMAEREPDVMLNLDRHQ